MLGDELSQSSTELYCKMCREVRWARRFRRSSCRTGKLSEFLCLGVCNSKVITSRVGLLFVHFIYSVPRNDFLGC